MSLAQLPKKNFRLLSNALLR